MKRALLFLFVVFLLFTQLAMSQEKKTTAPKGEPMKPPELTEIERLTLQSFLKDFTIAQLRRQAVQRIEDNARGVFWTEVKMLFQKKGISEEDYLFNPKTMRFEAKPAPAVEPESAGDRKKD